MITLKKKKNMQRVDVDNNKLAKALYDEGKALTCTDIIWTSVGFICEYECRIFTNEGYAYIQTFDPEDAMAAIIEEVAKRKDNYDKDIIVRMSTTDNTITLTFWKERE